MKITEAERMAAWDRMIALLSEMVVTTADQMVVAQETRGHAGAPSTARSEQESGHLSLV